MNCQAKTSRRCSGEVMLSTITEMAGCRTASAAPSARANTQISSGSRANISPAIVKTMASRAAVATTTGRARSASWPATGEASSAPECERGEGNGGDGRAHVTSGGDVGVEERKDGSPANGPQGGSDDQNRQLAGVAAHGGSHFSVAGSFCSNFDIEDNTTSVRFVPNATPGPVGCSHVPADALGRIRARGTRLHRGGRGRDRAAHRHRDVAAVPAPGRVLPAPFRRAQHRPGRLAGAAGPGHGGPPRQLQPVPPRRRLGCVRIDDDPPPGPDGRARSDRALPGSRPTAPAWSSRSPGTVGTSSAPPS